MFEIRPETKLAVIGFGTVGKALANYLKKDRPDLLINDPALGFENSLKEADVSFLCLPTPTLKDGSQDISEITNVLDQINAEGKETAVVIKSTVLPGTTERLQELYPKLLLFHNPEFLRERHSQSDMENPKMQLIGETSKTEGLGQHLFKVLPVSHFRKVMKSGETEMIKYGINTGLSVKLTWLNQLNDYCEKERINFKKVKQGIICDKRFGTEYFAIAKDGKKGYGGRCLPKDTRAFAIHSNKPLFKKVAQINRAYRQLSKKHD